MLLRKQAVTESCYEASLARFRYLFDMFDKVVVSFSGGKDSTVVLNLALQIAREKGKLPLSVVFFDEEAIHPPTIEYVERVRQNPDLDFHWYCLEIEHRNACSTQEPYWHCWEKGKEAIWTRPMPAFAIRSHPYFKKGMTIPDFSPLVFGPENGNICFVTGIRAQESIRRLRTVLKRKRDNYINQTPENKYFYKAHPIYDWTAEDVWVACDTLGWDYNHTYDVMDKAGISIFHQRVCPPFGEEPLRGLWMYAECFPEMWHKMLNRVAGVGTAWRYANTELYVTPKHPPEGMTWKAYTDLIISRYKPEHRVIVRDTINTCIKLHYRKSKLPLGDETPDLLSGCSWKFLCKIAIKGDFKGRTSGSMQVESERELRKQNLTFEQALQLYGTDSYRREKNIELRELAERRTLADSAIE